MPINWVLRHKPQHVPQERLYKAMFPMWFMIVCAQWLPFTLSKEHAHKQGFFSKVFMPIKCMDVPFFDLMKGELE